MTRYLEIKSGSISETIKRLSDDYQAIFKAELEKTGKGIGSMTPDEKKAFFNKIDKMHNAKNEMAQSNTTKPDDSKTVMVVKPGAPAGQEKVIRVPKEKLADYKSKGYVEAESYIPEAKKIDELTAGQKKLPPALQKAIKAKEKKEEVELEEVETVEEAAGANQLTNLNDKITRMQMNLSKLDMAKPESKTKEAIIKSDLTTAKLRLQDLMLKRNKETEKPMNEAKKTYKSMKKSVKKEEETPKKTMTDKPLTKIDVDPKLPTH